MENIRRQILFSNSKIFVQFHPDICSLGSCLFYATLLIIYVTSLLQLVIWNLDEKPLDVLHPSLCIFPLYIRFHYNIRNGIILGPLFQVLKAEENSREWTWNAWCWKKEMRVKSSNSLFLRRSCSSYSARVCFKVVVISRKRAREARCVLRYPA